MHTPASEERMGMAAPVLSVLLGLWLFVSAFALHRPPGQFVVTALLGIAAAVTAVVSIYARGARYVGLGIASLLFFTAVLGGGSRAAVWHNVVIAAVMVIASGFGDRRAPSRDERRLAHA